MAQLAQFQGFLRVGLAVMVGGMVATGAVADDTRAKKERPAPAVGEAPLKPAAAVKPGLAGSFLSGRFAKQNQDLREAARFLKETLARDPENEQLQQETMRMHLLAGDVPSALELAHKLEKNASSDPLVASLLMLESVKANDFVQAKAVIEKTSNAGLFGLIRPVIVEWLNVAQDPKRKNIDLKAAIDKAGFFAPFINYHTALMYDVAGNAASAQGAYAKANVDPSVTPYRVIEALANFHVRQGKHELAQAAYDAYAKANPQSTLIPEKINTSASNKKPLVADAKQGLAELFFTTASILFGEDATQDTFLYLRIALDLRPDLPPAQLMLASLYEQVEDYKQAIVTYDTIPEGSVFYRRAQVRKALNYEALKQRDKAIELLDMLATKYPSDATALITKGDMQRDAKEFDEAAETYSLAITRTEPLTQADWPLLYARGISYERAGEWDLAEADFKRALTLEPSQPDVLNYLAYSWLTMNKSLDKAREYLEIASEQRPEDPHIMDSVGWAYFLTGDFKTAVEKFEQAVEMLPDDATVNEHLGDAYWRIGRETEARYQWERALTFNPEKEVMEQLKTKLANGLPPLPESEMKSATSRTSLNAKGGAMSATQVP
jgi:tetratricopeptide (TPR) repeat protein